MNIIKIRGIVSTVLILSGTVTFITGTILYFMKYGMWLVFTRKFLYDVHAISALIMAIGVILHFILNSRIYKTEIKTLFIKKKN